MKKNRTALKEYFKKGAIPTEANFADLIESMLNQEEDNISKEPNAPLKILATGVDEALITFYRTENNEQKPSWLVKQKPDGKAGLSISDTAANRLFIENGSGNIGIGTITPTFKLHVKGSTSTDAELRLDPSKWNAAGDYSQLSFGDANHYIRGEFGNGMKFYDSDKFVFDGSNVGIGTGTAALTKKLEVSGTVRISSVTAAEVALSLGGNGDFQIDAPNVPGGRFVVKDNGNVGIGTMTIHNPQGWNKVLDILGTSHARLNVRSSGGVVTSLFSHDDWGGPRGVIGTDSNHPLTFVTQYAHRMTIDANGNVGIGITTPGAKLHVSAGQIQLDGNQKIFFSDTDTTNNLKIQLWSGYGLGINNATLFYAANGQHSWRDTNGANERMLLTTAADGGLTVKGTGVSSFAGSVSIGSLNLKGFTANDADEWPNFIWYRDTAANWDEGLIKGSSSHGKFGRAGFGIHMHQTRQFSLYSTGWDSLFAVEGGTGNTYIKGSLAVGSLTVTGDLTAGSIRSKPFVQNFKVAGDNDKFYPVVFVDEGWADGALTLEISRPNTHTDSEWRGSLVSVITCHSSAWGHGSEFCRAEIYSSKDFIGGYQNSSQQAKLVVWLRGGGTTYFWRSNHRASLEDSAPTAKEFGGDKYPIKTAADSYAKVKQVYFSAYVEVNEGRSGNQSPLAMKVASQNIGDAYSTGTSKFTAPVKGVYLFTMTALKVDGDDWLHWYLRLNEGYPNAGGTTSDESSERCLISMKSNGGGSSSRTMIIPLNAGDKIWIQQAGSGRVDNFRSGLEGVLLYATM